MRARRDAFVAALVLVPLALFLAAFLVLPTIAAIVAAFGPRGSFRPAVLTHLLAEPHRSDLLDSLALAVVSAVLAAVVAVLAAVGLRRVRRPRAIARALAAWSAAAARLGGAPLAFVFVVTIGLQTMLTQTLTELGRIAHPLPPNAFWRLVALYLLFGVPLMLVVIVPAVSGLRSCWREAASALGARAGLFRRRVAVPVLAPAVLGGFVIASVSTFTAHTSAAIVSTETLHPLHPAIHPVLPGEVAAVAEEQVTAALASWMIALLMVSLLVAMLLVRRSLRWVSA